MSDPIKRFYVRDGFVLDEHPTGQVVRYGHHMARIEKLEAENKRLRDGLSYIARRGYTGASHVALELLNGKVYPADPRAALEEGGDDG